jgi:hypothetical protein
MRITSSRTAWAKLVRTWGCGSSIEHLPSRGPGLNPQYHKKKREGKGKMERVGKDKEGKGREKEEN